MVPGIIRASCGAYAIRPLGPIKRPPTCVLSPKTDKRRRDLPWSNCHVSKEEHIRLCLIDTDATSPTQMYNAGRSKQIVMSLRHGSVFGVQAKEAESMVIAIEVAILSNGIDS
jgi:hypothetical protein